MYIYYLFRYMYAEDNILHLACFLRFDGEGSSHRDIINSSAKDQLACVALDNPMPRSGFGVRGGPHSPVVTHLSILTTAAPPARDFLAFLPLPS